MRRIRMRGRIHKNQEIGLLTILPKMRSYGIEDGNEEEKER